MAGLVSFRFPKNGKKGLQIPCDCCENTHPIPGVCQERPHAREQRGDAAVLLPLMPQTSASCSLGQQEAGLTPRPERVRPAVPSNVTVPLPASAPGLAAQAPPRADLEPGALHTSHAARGCHGNRTPPLHARRELTDSAEA